MSSVSTGSVQIPGRVARFFQNPSTHFGAEQFHAFSIDDLRAFLRVSHALRVAVEREYSRRHASQYGEEVYGR